MWINLKKIIVIGFILLHHKSYGFQRNVFDNFCNTGLLLNNPINLNDSSFPLKVEITEKISSGEIVIIKIKVNDNLQIKGFSIQARKSSNELPIGSFLTSNSEIIPINCFDSIDSIAFYMKKLSSDTEITFTWKSPIVDKSLNFKL